MLSPVTSAIRNLFWPVLALGCHSTCWTDPVFKDNEYFKLLSETNVYGFPRQPQFLFLHYWALLKKFTYKGIQNKLIFTSENQSSLHLPSTFIHHRQFTKYIIKKNFPAWRGSFHWSISNEFWEEMIQVKNLLFTCVHSAPAVHVLCEEWVYQQLPGRRPLFLDRFQAPQQQVP